LLHNYARIQAREERLRKLDYDLRSVRPWRSAPASSPAG